MQCIQKEGYKREFEKDAETVMENAEEIDGDNYLPLEDQKTKKRNRELESENARLRNFIAQSGLDLGSFNLGEPMDVDDADDQNQQML